MPPTAGISIPSSARPWTPCSCPIPTCRSTCSLAASAVAWPCASCCSRLPTCCCSTSPRTTWTPSRSCGSSTSCTTTRARCLPSHTIATSWITLPSGSARSTAVTFIPTRAITPRIWRPRPRVSRPRATVTPSSPSAWRPSSSGYAARPRLARPRTRPVWLATRRWRPRPAQARSSTGPTSASLWARVWATRCSRPITCTRSSMAACSSMTFRSPCRATALWALSAPTVSVRPRCSRRFLTSTRTVPASTPIRTYGRSSRTAWTT